MVITAIYQQLLYGRLSYYLGYMFLGIMLSILFNQMRVLKKGLTDEELVELLDWNISDDDQDGSDIKDLNDSNNIVELFDNNDIPLIINNNEVTNDLIFSIYQ
ncbi:hypothetical protein QTP88_008790 [Uroleucon formosanum]